MVHFYDETVHVMRPSLLLIKSPWVQHYGRPHIALAPQHFLDETTDPALELHHFPQSSSDDDASLGGIN